MKNQIFHKIYMILYAFVYRFLVGILYKVNKTRYFWKKRIFINTNNKDYINLPFLGKFSKKNIFARVNKEFLTGCSLGVRQNAQISAGGIVRFITDADQIDVDMVLKKYVSPYDQPQMALNGYSGIDVYVRTSEGFFWKGCYTANCAAGGKLRQRISLGENNHFGQEVWIYLPNFVPVSNFSVLPIKGNISPVKYSNRKIIGFYGSSITQGCASCRAGLSYTAQVGRSMDCDVVNLGFSSSARGEKQIAEYISRLSLDALIIEYDHNVTVDELRESYHRFFGSIRINCPQMPIVLLSRISGGISISLKENDMRREIIYNALYSAHKNGYLNTYYIDGYKIAERYPCGALLADDRHPNDYGMAIIADEIIKVLNTIIDFGDKN